MPTDPRWASRTDFTLVSSDHTCFNVPSYHLFSASAVFRDAAGMCSKPAWLELSDEVLETADILRIFLSFLTEGVLMIPRPPRDEPTETLRHISTLKTFMGFLDKYDCHALRRLALCKLRIAAQDGRINALCAFVVGAIADDLTLASVRGNELSKVDRAAVGEEIFRGVPDTYMRALDEVRGREDGARHMRLAVQSRRKGLRQEYVNDYMYGGDFIEL